MERKGKGKLKKKESAKKEAKIETLELREEERSIGDWILQDSIGKGGCGVVYRGICKSSGIEAAIKRIDLRGLKQHEADALGLEFKLLQNLTHPNIVKLLDHVQMNDHLHIILEFMELGALVHGPRKAYPEVDVVRWTHGVLQGLKYLHERGVVHRDIKGANILLSKSGEVKLTDFGVASEIIGEITSADAVGTPYWMAPEVIQMSKSGTACDIWSLGCTVIELLMARPPYYDANPMSAMYRIVSQDMPIPDTLSENCRSFLKLCFVKDPDSRATAEELLKHPWVETLAKKFEARKRWKKAAAQLMSKKTSDVFDMKAYAEQVIKLKRMQQQIKKDEELAQKIQQEEQSLIRQSDERKNKDEELAQQMQQEEQTRVKQSEDRKVREEEDAKLASVLIEHEQREAARRKKEEEESLEIAKQLAATEERRAKVNAFLHSTEGTSFIKYGRKGKPHTRRVRVIQGKNGLARLDWNTGNVTLDMVISIESGKKTKVFSRAGTTIPDELCFSVFCRTRTLDLQATTTQIRDDWVFGLTNLLAAAQAQRTLPPTVLNKQSSSVVDPSPLRSPSGRQINPTTTSSPSVSPPSSPPVSPRPSPGKLNSPLSQSSIKSSS